MKYSEEYIAICRKLHDLRPKSKEDWELGDGLVFDDDTFGNGKEVFWITVRHQGRNGLLLAVNGNFSSDYPMKKAVWIPQRESDWMKQPEWNTDPARFWQFGCAHRDDSSYQFTVSQLRRGVNGQHFVTEFSRVKDDPLRACAQAWENVREGSK